MYYLAQVCRVCLGNDAELIEMHVNDVDEITFQKKLTSCFPNMIFEETNIKTFLCENCSNILRKMYDFRELCINSDRLLMTYVSQLKQTNSFKNSENCNLNVILMNNYEDLTPTRQEIPQKSEIKLKKFGEVVIKTEIPEVECDDDEWLKSNSLLDIKNEPVDIHSDYQNYIDTAKRTDEQNNTTSNNGSSVPESSRASLKRGSKINKTGERFECDVCRKTYKNTHNLQNHKFVHTGLRPYKCDVCGKCFAYANSLRKHYQIHTGEKPFKCDLCKLRFRHGNSFKVHRRTHTGEKPFECPVCGYRFISGSQLRAHVRAHTGEKPYECDFCKRRFDEFCKMQFHKRLHRPDKCHVCTFCHRSFYQLSNLQLHIRIHTGESLHTCDVCDKSFSYSSSLRRHRKIHHAI